MSDVLSIYNVNGRVFKTYDSQFGIKFSNHKDMYLYGTAESFGKLCYALGESVLLDHDMVCGRGTVDDFAYEIWCAIVECHGNKRGRKPNIQVLIVNSYTCEVVKAYRWE